VPLVDADREALLEAVAAREQAGVYVWHSDTTTIWFFAFRGPFSAAPAVPVLRVETNRPIVGVRGLEPGAYERCEERVLRIPLTAERSGEHMLVATLEAGIQLKARVEGAALPFFVGPTLTELSGPLELWARDPHGMAWLDVAGDRAPDLFVTRGALKGQLGPPLDPKADDFYLARGAPGPPYERVELPRSYARGRMVQWVDLEGDGRAELYTGNKGSPNSLLRLEPGPESLQVRESARELGLDLLGADAFAWLDLDDDGDDDLVTLDQRAGLGVLRNQGGRRFEREDAAERGLRLAGLERSPGGNGEPEGGIDDHDLLVLDLDNDGDLELLVTGWGTRRECVLFRAEGGRFVDATEGSGLGVASGATQVVAADFDGDAYLDLLCLGSQSRLLANVRGRFTPVPLPAAWGEREWPVGAACDVDGDGRIDVALAGKELALARNRSAQAGAWIRLSVLRDGRIPIGALVRAVYGDGTVHACRVGSTHRGRLSQAHGVIALASPEGSPLREIRVTFPGGAQRSVPVTTPGALTIAID
jgi:hypothetical protein